jgi:diacylglycerol kinase (ATP)
MRQFPRVCPVSARRIDGEPQDTYTNPGKPVRNGSKYLLMYKHVHVIINPATGQDRPVLGVLNSIFQPAGIDWDVFITKKAGDARRIAQEAAAEGVDAVAVYGGDGTVMEAASGLVGTGVPLAIFPGGTGNVLSVELGIPADLVEACALVAGDSSQIRCIDLGRINDHYFLLSAGVGFVASVIEGANRQSKHRLGILAYLLAGLRALRRPALTCYDLTLDGKHVEAEGITCMIANSTNIGQFGLKLVEAIDVSDGLLDVIVIRRGDWRSFLSLVLSMITRNEAAKPIYHWQAREIGLTTRPPQTLQIDGEIVGQTPLTATILPQAARFIVPPSALVGTDS